MGNVELVECAVNQAAIDDQQTAILEIAFDGVIELDSKGLITAWNSRAEKLFGWLRGEAIGQHIELIVPPRHRESFLSSVAEIVAWGGKFEPGAPLPMRALHRDGRRFSTE